MAEDGDGIGSQFPLESFEDFPDDALCVICQMPSLDNISMCISGHNACRKCADQMLVADPYSRCASCRGDLTRVTVAGNKKWVANTALNNMVNDFKIKCPNVRRGCTHTCKANAMAAHVAECDYKEMACKCSGCTWKGPACDWQEHMRQVDHGKFLVDMMLFTQQVCATMCDKFDKAEEQQDKFKKEVMDPFKTQLSCIGTGVNNLHATCRTIEGHTNKHDGSSVRSKQRDRKNQKDVDNAIQERNEHETARKLAEDKVTSLKRKVEELEARPAPTVPFVSEDIHAQACSSRDRYFRERDEARHESYMAQQRIHDQHKMLKKMMPGATGACPCTLSTCDAGGGSEKRALYVRRGPRRTVGDD